MGYSERFAMAMARIDAANAADPTTLDYDGAPGPKEPTHARLMSEWISRLRPEASEALHLAARAHHLRRWERPRTAYPAGREGYLRWREDAKTFHVAETAAILRDVGYEKQMIARVGEIMCKRGIRADEETQAYEDALALVFIETQLHDLAARTVEATLLNAIRRTWLKMSPQGQTVALGIELRAADRALIEKALTAER